MLSRRKLALTLAFTGLVAIAVGVSCRGFFVNPTLTSITIDGPTVVEVGETITLSAFGVYGTAGGGNGNGNTLTSDVSWSSATPTAAAITGTCATEECGSAVISGVAPGTSSVTATSQSVSGSSTITVYLGTITDFQVCEGSFGDTTSCSSGNGGTLAWAASGVSSNSVTQDFVVQGESSNSQGMNQEYDLTTASSFTVNNSSSSDITCTNTASPASCNVPEGTTPGSYTIVVTYPSGSSNPTGTVTINVTVSD
jgi:trimeric autotransporter adhesin